MRRSHQSRLKPPGRDRFAAIGTNQRVPRMERRILLKEFFEAVRANLT
jgi:hypothetical protein